jgi:hypothetical protein
MLRGANQRDCQKILAKSKIYQGFNHVEGGQGPASHPLASATAYKGKQIQFATTDLIFLPCRYKLLLGDE